MVTNVNTPCLSHIHMKIPLCSSMNKGQRRDSQDQIIITVFICNYNTIILLTVCFEVIIIIERCCCCCCCSIRPPLEDKTNKSNKTPAQSSRKKKAPRTEVSYFHISFTFIPYQVYEYQVCLFNNIISNSSLSLVFIYHLSTEV